MSKCIGCGISLQDSNKLELGYTPKLTNSYCERCFKTIHYGNSKKIDNINNDLILEKINVLNYFTFFITDFLSLNERVINTYNKINTPKLLVINKCDLIPNNLILNKLETKIKEVYKVEDIIFVSAKDKYNINPLIKKIEEYQDVLFCGETSSGKSTLINLILGSNLTTSKYSNTTLEFIKLNYEGYTIYDTPGLFTSDKTLYNKIKMSTKVLDDNYELLIGDYIINFKNKTSMCLYIKDSINIKTRKRSTKLTNNVKLSSNSDILLDDIGFINTKQEGSLLVNKPVEVRDSIVGGK